jgi:hypothetical protein
MLHVTLLKQQEQAKSKTSRREIIKRAKINEIETKTYKKTNETKSWFFEKINSIDKPLTSLTKMRREPKLVKSEMKKGENKHQGNSEYY